MNGECAIVFRYAYYLQNLILEDAILKQYDLDCEYNRNGIETKLLPMDPQGDYRYKYGISMLINRDVPNWKWI